MKCPDGGFAECERVVIQCHDAHDNEIFSFVAREEKSAYLGCVLSQTEFRRSSRSPWWRGDVDRRHGQRLSGMADRINRRMEILVGPRLHDDADIRRGFWLDHIFAQS